MDFLAAGFEPPHIRRIFSPFSSKARSLNHSAILLPKIWLTPAIVTTGRDFSTNRPAYGLFWQQDSTLLVSGVYLVRSPRKLEALTTRPSCCPKVWSTPAIVTTGRDFSTNRPAYGLFWQQESNLRISGVYLVRSLRKLEALTTRPSCCENQFGIRQP